MPSKEQDSREIDASLPSSEEHGGSGRDLENNGSSYGEQRQPANTGKGKEKEPISAADRLKASASAVLRGAFTDRSVPNMPAGQKGDGISSSSTYTSKVHSEFLSRPSNQGDLQGDAQRTFRQTPHSSASTSGFESFATAQAPTETISTEIQVGKSTASQSVSEQETLDGADVVDLLSKPDSFDDAPLSEDDDDNLTVHEAERLRRALFDTGSAVPFWDSLLNFSPTFLTNPEASGDDATALMGTPDQEEARSVWLKQWNDVLSSYTDEVWGDLSHLVEQAKEEMNHPNDDLGNGRTGDSKALERLRQILAHVRGH